MQIKRLEHAFFERDALEVAPELVGKLLCVRTDGRTEKVRIAETEAYRGEEDTACHAHKGRTPRTEVMYGTGGTMYIYMCYGIHWLMNIVTGGIGDPQCVLLRAGIAPWDGPAKLTKHMGIDKRYNGIGIYECKDVWIEDDGRRYEISAGRRIGIGYADEADQARLWRYGIQSGGEENAL